MSRDISPFGVRMPSKVKDRIEKAAAQNLRSINAEVVSRLTASFDAPKGNLAGYSDGDLIKELMDRYERGAIYIRIGEGAEE